MFLVYCDRGEIKVKSLFCVIYVYHQPVSEGNDSQRKSSSGEQVLLHSGQGQTSAATSERHAEGKSNELMFSVN